MKNIFRKIIVFLLKTEARLILRRYKPKIVAVTGTVGKTSAKEAIALILGTKFSVRKNEKSYNSEFGVPLTIIGAKSAWGNVFGWFAILAKGIVAIFKKQDYPEWLVLEAGVDRPGDMKEFVSWIKPDVAVITAIGSVDDVSVHVENFKNQEELIKEKLKLAQNVKNDGITILNGDDTSLSAFREKSSNNIISYGFNEKNDLRASNFAVGSAFKIDYDGNIVPCRLAGAISKQHVFAVLAGLAVGLSQDLNLIEMIEAVASFKTLPGRMNVLEGIKNSTIIDDTYNASPIAVTAGLEALAEFQATRRISVLGDMLELGKFSADEHRKIGKLIKEKGINLLFVVGQRAKFISEGTLKAGFAQENIFEFQNSTEAAPAIKEKIQEGDVVFVKGSQSMRMEKIVEQIMARPEDAEKLLVRQEPEWKRR